MKTTKYTGMEQPKYNLTFWQRIELPFLWLYWKLSVADNKKIWHRVKKGMEKHNHDFTVKIKEQEYTLLQCDHEGCNLCTDPDYI